MFERSRELKSVGRELREEMIRKRKRRAVEAEGKWLVGEIIGDVRSWRVRILWKERWTSKKGEKKVERRGRSCVWERVCRGMGGADREEQVQSPVSRM